MTDQLLGLRETVHAMMELCLVVREITRRIPAINDLESRIGFITQTASRAFNLAFQAPSEAAQLEQWMAIKARYDALETELLSAVVGKIGEGK